MKKKRCLVVFVLLTMAIGFLSAGSGGGFGGFITGYRFIDRPVTVSIISWTGLGGISVDYQIAGNLIPGVPFEAFFSYTPVVGFRLQWGSFY